MHVYCILANYSILKNPHRNLYKSLNEKITIFRKMSKKKVFVPVISLAIVMFLFVPTVSAALVPQILTDFMTWLFLKLPAGMQAGDDAAIAFFKFVIWILVFAIVYYGCTFAFKDQKRIASVVAMVMALITVFFLPTDVLRFLLIEYSVVVSVLLGLVPVIVGVILSRNVREHQPGLSNILMWMVAIMCFVLWAYFTGFSATVPDEQRKLYDFLGQLIGVGGIIALIYAVIGMLFGFANSGSLWGRGGFGRDWGGGGDTGRYRDDGTHAPATAHPTPRSPRATRRRSDAIARSLHNLRAYYDNMQRICNSVPPPGRRILINSAIQYINGNVHALNGAQINHMNRTALSRIGILRRRQTNLMAFTYAYNMYIREYRNLYNLLRS